MKTINKYQVAPFLEVQECGHSGYKSLFATQDLLPHTILSKLNSRKILSAPSRYTLQIKDNQHIELKPAYLQYTNHSCNPNVFFDTQMMHLSSLRHIQRGEEIAFFYPSTEWQMNEPFDCSCNSANCLGRIRGAAFLTPDNLDQYKLSDYIYRKHDRQGLSSGSTWSAVRT